jgi:hypothetical protein
MILRRAVALVVIGLLVWASTGGAMAQAESGIYTDTGPGTGQAALGAGFSYAGRLVDEGVAVTGVCDLQFSLWNALSVGAQVGDTQTVTGVTLTEGLFMVSLNDAAQFGGSAFNGEARWLAIAVKCPPDTGFTALFPRQPLLATPYASHASGSSWSGLTGIPAGFADGVDDTGGGGAAWQLSGNGATPTDFLGTTNPVTLTLRVSNTVGYRLVPGGVPSLLGGYSGNTVSSGEDGAVIAGGGSAIFGANIITDSFGVIGGGAGNTAAYFATVGGGLGNSALDTYATVSGGTENTAVLLGAVGGGSGNDVAGSAGTIAGGQDNLVFGGFAAVGGGYLNTISLTAPFGTIGGGRFNEVTGPAATIGGGFDNDAAGYTATIAGGQDNVAEGILSAVGGGQFSWAHGDYSTVGGGYDNVAYGLSATVSGGTDNYAGGESATIGGGFDNNAAGQASTVAGGDENTAFGPYAAVGGGSNNQANAWYDTIGGGFGNIVEADRATIAGGYFNTASGVESSVGGGYGHYASGENATVAGGDSNFSTGGWSSIGGGYDNLAQGNYSTVGGGYSNVANDLYTTTGGGLDNSASGDYATVGGGQNNIASGNYSVVPGGIDNRASGAGSVAMGSHTRAAHPGSFIFADVDSVNVISTTANNQFIVRAAGGYFLYTNSALSNGCLLAAGGGSWSCGSDRNNKANFGAVDGVAVLDTLMGLPITTWNYTTQDAAIRHMGPMAQDFYAAFGLGEGETTITGVDADGVALAAIQGLYTVVQERDAEIAALKAAQAETDARLAALEQAAPPSKDIPLLALVLVAGLIIGAGLSASVLTPGLQWTGFGLDVTTRRN